MVLAAFSCFLMLFDAFSNCFAWVLAWSSHDSPIFFHASRCPLPSSRRIEAGTLLCELFVDAELQVRELREEVARRLAVPKPHLALLADGDLLQVGDLELLDVA